MKRTFARIKFNFIIIFGTFFLVSAVFLFVFYFSAKASINKQVNYQGKLTDGNNWAVADGNYNMVFKIYDAVTGGNLLWTGTHTSTNGNPVAVSAGIFSVLLGSGTGNTLNLDFSNSSNYYLQIEIYNSGTSAWEVFDPRRPMASVPQAYNANNVIGDGRIDVVTDSSSDASLKVTQSGTGDVAQFFDGSTQVVTVKDGGNVGIGTTSPASLLSIEKDQNQISNGVPLVSLSTTGTATSYKGALLHLYTTRGVGNDDTDLFKIYNSGGSTFLTVRNTGNVGIGTTAPGSKLEVAGTLTVSGSNLTTLGGNLTVTGTAWTATPTISGVITATSGLTANGALTANSTFTLGDNGDTGSVNTSDWDISTTGAMTGIGAITMDGLLTGTAGATITGAAINMNASSNFAINIGTGTSTGAISIGGGSNTVGINSSSWDISTAGAISGVTTLGMSGVLTSTLATGTAPLSVTSTTLNTNLNADLLDGQHGSYYAPASNISGTTNYVSKFTGTGTIGNSQIFDNGTNVGIGTTAPTTKLEVAMSGASLFALQNTNNYRFSHQLGTGLGAGGFGGYLIAATASTTNFGIRTAATSGDPNFVIDAAGNVGIGTTAPINKLHVEGTGGGSAGIYLNSAVPSATSNTLYNNGGSLYWNGSAVGGGSSQWTTQGTSLYYNTGNIGIGTTNPTNKLYVKGSSNNTMTLQSSNTEGTSLVITNETNFANYEFAVTGTGNGYGSGHFLFWDGLNARGPLILNANGNIRIGHDTGYTATTASSLSIYGNLAVGGSYISNAAPTNGMIVQGNLGIGTTAPGAKLDVAGSVITTGNAIFKYHSNIGLNNGLTLGTVNKATAGTGGAGQILIASNDASNRLEGWMTLITDATASSRRLDIGVVEQGVAWRNIVLNKDGGNVGIGIAVPTYKLQLNGQPAANGYTAWTNYSDARLKENITPLINGSILDKISQLNPVTFNYNSLTGYDAETRARRVSGFIAQELQQVFPEMVGETTINGTTYLDTNTSNLQLYLLKGIQELAVQTAEINGKWIMENGEIQVKALNTEVASQKLQVQSLDTRLATIEASNTAQEMTLQELEQRLAELEAEEEVLSAENTTESANPENTLDTNSSELGGTETKLSLSDQLQGEIIANLNVENLTVIENIIVAGDIKVEGHIIVGEDTAGEIIFDTKNEIRKRIEFKKPYLGKPIVTATLSGGKNLFYSVKNVDTFGFEIVIDGVLRNTETGMKLLEGDEIKTVDFGEEIKFNWQVMGR